MENATAERAARGALALLALVCSLLACNVYEADLARGTRPQGQSVADDAGASVDDAGEAECEDRPGDARCPRSCPERCNGRDDDCDGVVDETASERCALAHADAVCRNGACLIARCREGYRDCDEHAANGCEVVPWDPEHCQGCGRGCALPHARALCVNGACQVAECLDGHGDCDGDRASCETQVNSDAHCGSCEHACSELPHGRGSCEDGHCQLQACAAGYADCDHDRESCETDLRADAAHCGSCERSCAFQVESPHARVGCQEGACKPRCAVGYGDCNARPEDGCEAPLTTDHSCGACDRSCSAPHAQAHCVEGQCALTGCEAGRADCNGALEDGCEQALDAPEACGSCERRCQLPHAATRCNAAAERCEIERCEDGFADCDGSTENGCERDVRPAAMSGQGPCLPDMSCSVASQDGHNFYFCNAAHTWDEARALCRTQLNGELARLRDGATRDFIKARLRERVWIGHNDRARADLWVWSNNGVPFWQGRANGRALNGAFASWTSGEPNGSGDCGALAANGGMDDLTCTSTLPFVCEVSADLCPEDPGKTDPGQCGCGRPDVDGNGDGFADCPG